MSEFSDLPEDRKAWLHTVFVTALEGGINYWAAVDKYRIWKAGSDFDGSGGLADIEGFHAVIVSTEDEWGVFEGDADRTALRIDGEVIRRGIDLFSDYCRGRIDSAGQTREQNPNFNSADIRGTEHYWVRFLIADLTNGVDGDFDSEVADQVVQWGLFGQGFTADGAPRHDRGDRHQPAVPR